jgi:apolipoprotein N-acyltransferase
MKKNIVLAILSGLLLWLAWPPMPYTSFILFFGLVPMLIAMENIIQSDDKYKGRKIFRLAFLGFFIWNTLSIYWVYNSLKIIGNLIAIPVSLIPYSLGPLLMAAACWLYYRMRKYISRNLSLIMLVCFWMGYEYLHQTWALAFPWMTLGNGFAVSHQWIQWYAYTGVYGGTLWIWIANILIFLIYTGIREKQTKQQRLKLVSSLTLTILLPLSLSLYLYNTYVEASDPANIVVVQPNVDPYQKHGVIPVQAQIYTLTHLSDSVAQPNTEFFLWPESAIPESVDEDAFRNSNYCRQVQQFLNKYKNGNVITGVETTKLYHTAATESANPIAGSTDYYDAFNSAVNIENSAKLQFYHKSKLVPGAEEIPFAAGIFKPIFSYLGGAAGSYGKQKEPTVFYSQAGIGAAPVICYESIWGEYVATYVNKGAQFIAIITNDGWWENTSGKDQHLDYAKLRAIETRRWVCRSANTGISAFINQRGDIVKHSAWWVQTAIKQDINLNSDLTFYVKYGDYIPKFASLIAMIGIVFIFFRMAVKRWKKLPPDGSVV